MYVPEVAPYMYEAFLPITEAIFEARHLGEAQARVFHTPHGSFVAAVCSELDEVGAALVVPASWGSERDPDSGLYLTETHETPGAELLPGLTDLAKDIAEEIWCKINEGLWVPA